MDLCSNLHAISEVHFVAAGSGAYMTSKMLEFFDHYGTQLRPEDFDSAWDSFTSCGTKNNSHCEENEISPLIKSAIFIAPSLPSPTGVLSLLGNWTRPSIYDHMKLYAPNIQFFPVLKTHPEMDRPHLDMELENQEQVLFTSDLDILKTILEERFQPLFHNEETGPSA